MRWRSLRDLAKVRDAIAVATRGTDKEILSFIILQIKLYIPDKEILRDQSKDRPCTGGIMYCPIIPLFSPEQWHSGLMGSPALNLPIRALLLIPLFSLVVAEHEARAHRRGGTAYHAARGVWDRRDLRYA